MNKSELMSTLVGLDIGAINDELGRLADILLDPGKLHDVHRLSGIELRTRAIDALRQMRSAPNHDHVYGIARRMLRMGLSTEPSPILDEAAIALINQHGLVKLETADDPAFFSLATDVVNQRKMAEAIEAKKAHDAAVREAFERGRQRLRERLEKVLQLTYHDVMLFVVPKLLTDGPDLDEMLACSDLDLLKVAEMVAGDEILQARPRGAPIQARLVPLGGWFTVPLQDGGQDVYERVRPPADAAARTTVAQPYSGPPGEPDGGPPSIWVRRCFDGRMQVQAYPMREESLVFPMRG